MDAFRPITDNAPLTDTPIRPFDSAPVMDTFFNDAIPPGGVHHTEEEHTMKVNVGINTLCSSTAGVGSVTNMDISSIHELDDYGNIVFGDGKDGDGDGSMITVTDDVAPTSTNNIIHCSLVEMLNISNGGLPVLIGKWVYDVLSKHQQPH